ncbi:MAG: Gfo/Idh/MocA family oxidoreductase [Verrucomicrobia bacterium]|nr:Gfo/Idh/MocA family oxidoreductase [Verrucomicrobiota bacterium]
MTDSLKPVRIALIGAGWIAAEHARALRRIPGARLTAIFDAVRDRAVQLAQTHETRAAESFEQAVELADMVWICSPPALHEPQITAALRAGREVFCEKPLTLSIASARTISQAAGASGRFVAVGHSNRYYPAYRKARDLFVEGALGAFVSVWSQRIGNYPREQFPPWRLDPAQSGGMTVEVGVHEIDFLLWVGGEIEMVFAQRACAVINPPDFDDSMSAVMKFRGGGFGRLDLSWASAVDISRRGILGDRAGLMVERDLTDVELCPLRGKAERIPATSPVDPVTKENLGIFWQAQDILQRRSEGRPPEVGVREGIRAIEVALAMQASARENRAVRLEEFVGSSC